MLTIQDFTEVDKPPFCIPGKEKKWRKELDGLAEGKCLKAVFMDKLAAQHKASSILGTASRWKNVNYKIHSKVVPESGKYILYLWKWGINA